jgi:cysteine desulfurase
MVEPKTFYLDHCGSTPMSIDVKMCVKAMLDDDAFGNAAASHHLEGLRAESLLNAARHEIANVVNASPDSVLFTSGASEANNMVLWGHALRFAGRSPQILFGSTEHKSVFEACQIIQSVGAASVKELPVTSMGTINLAALEATLKMSKGTPTLVALMHINNEIPARHPVEDISAMCRAHGAYFHCDGVQGFVRESVDFSAGTFGSYVISPHKIYGPKGVGVLLLGQNTLSPRLNPPYRGGDQERGLRPGTHNTLAITAAATAVLSHSRNRAERVKHMRTCADVFTNTLLSASQEVALTVPIKSEAAGIVSFYAQNVDASSLLESLPMVCINKGSSCIGSSGEKFSHVPKALGLPIEIQANVLRASFGDGISLADSKTAALMIADVVKKMKSPH